MPRTASPLAAVMSAAVATLVSNRCRTTAAATLASRPASTPNATARTGRGDTGLAGVFAFSHTLTRTSGALSGDGVSICAMAWEKTSPTVSAISWARLGSVSVTTARSRTVSGTVCAWMRPRSRCGLSSRCSLSTTAAATRSLATRSA